MQGQLSTTSSIEITQSIDGPIITFITDALKRENSSLYKAELVAFRGNDYFKSKNTLRLNANDIDASGLSVLAVYKRFSNDCGDERPVIELNRDKGPYIERQLVAAGMHKQFEIRYR